MTPTAAGPPREEMAAELREAIEQGDLALYYQPVVALRDRVATEVEALLRWPRGGRDILAPADFIDVAQAFDLLAELERWSIHAAFEQLSRWRRATDLDLSLNLSEHFLYETALPEEIEAAAQRTGVDRRRLSVEVPEAALDGVNGSRLNRLNELAELGVGLTVDDYSGGIPAGRLRELPTRALKISRRVVAGIPDQPTNTETAHEVIRQAQEIGVQAIANGIESPGQLAALRDMGCEYGQGFLFSIPMPADVLAERAMSR